MSGEAHGRGLIDTNVVIHLAALDDAHLPGEIVTAVTISQQPSQCRDRDRPDAERIKTESEPACYCGNTGGNLSA